MMTYDEFILFRDVKIKNANHERVVKAFFEYLSSVSGNARALPDLVGRILNIDTSSLTVDKGCFNGVFDNVIPPYDNVDFYIKLSNGICLFIYGEIPTKTLRTLKADEYVLFVLSEHLDENIERIGNYIYIGDTKNN